MQLRLDKYGHIIGTEYLSDLVEKEHGTHDHGIICFPIKGKLNIALVLSFHKKESPFQSIVCISFSWFAHFIKILAATTGCLLL
jgi:hypothetical protein